MIPYGYHNIDESDVNHVINALRAEWITQGPTIEAFERVLCEYTGANYAVAVTSGTAALHLAALAVGIKEGDEAITSPVSFVASANCVLYVGASVNFVDIIEETALIDPDLIKSAIKPCTKLLIPVHYAGQSCNMETIFDIACENNLLIIEDAAHAIGTEYKGCKVGSCKYSDMTVFSFHPVKTITTGEGGAITTNDKKLYKKLCMLRSHGITKEKEEWSGDGGPWYYEMQSLGFNYRMTDFQAALGISQMKKLDTLVKRRMEIADYYRKRFNTSDIIQCLATNDDFKSAWHIFPLMVDFMRYKISKTEFFHTMKEKGIGMQVHYIPIYFQPYYKKKFGFSKGLCTKAERYYDATFTIPLYPAMKDDEIEYVSDTVLSYFNEHVCN